MPRTLHDLAKDHFHKYDVRIQIAQVAQARNLHFSQENHAMHGSVVEAHRARKSVENRVLCVPLVRLTGPGSHLPLEGNAARQLIPMPIELFSSRHDRRGFDCGEPALNEFLSRYVGQQQKRNLNRVYAAIDADGVVLLGRFAVDHQL
jgi:hypothetical protein